MAEEKNDKSKKTILFNATKKETHNPNNGFKKLCRRLKSNYRVAVNKDEIGHDISATLLVFGGPREDLDNKEAEEFKKWLHAGGRAMILLGSDSEVEGGLAMQSMLDEYGIKCNRDSVMRTAYYKYLHPKEVYIDDGVIVPDIIRKKNNAARGDVRRAPQPTKKSSSSFSCIRR
jgi:intraflagellar transport protein 52